VDALADDDLVAWFGFPVLEALEYAFRFAYRLTGQPADAEDLVQEGFMKCPSTPRQEPRLRMPRQRCTESYVALATTVSVTSGRHRVENNWQAAPTPLSRR
jgi:hypothetical protein